ncbi:MAG: VWA domain-containing protein [Acidobacteria bacterium]|nr:VWA domain-containing protein [Acidobacteriota bacterium]
MRRRLQRLLGGRGVLISLLLVPLSLGSQDGANSRLLGGREPRLRVDVDLVLVSVTVTDPYNRLVTGLGKEHFELLEDKMSQEILHFSSEDVPLSLGIVFDLSGSMKRAGKLNRASQAAVEFLNTANPQYEFFIVAFSDAPKIVTGFTSSVQDIQNSLLTAQAEGRTALLDALYLSLNTMREANNPKKAILVISDGGDNHSRYTPRNIKAAVRESDVQVYAIGIFDPISARGAPELVWGPSLLKDIAEMSGGRLFAIELYNLSDLPDVAATISIELRNQYVIGYRPTNVRRDGGWRKIQVKINAPKGLPPLNVFTRSGYYAPSQ